MEDKDIARILKASYEGWEDLSEEEQCSTITSFSDFEDEDVMVRWITEQQVDADIYKRGGAATIPKGWGYNIP